jgi:type I restriction enzyme, S subunit
VSWPTRRLSELGTWYGGSTPSKAEPSYWLGGTIPWLSPKDMGDEVLRETRDHITTAALDAGRAKMVPSGSVAVVTRSGILERTVPIAIVPFETTLNQDMKAVVPSVDVDARWMAWALRSQERQILSDDRKSGTTVASLDSGKFLSRTIPVPPTGEQRWIVEMLEDHLRRLRAAEMLLVQSFDRSKTLAVSSYLRSTRADVPSLSLGEVRLAAAYGTSARCSYDGAGDPVVRIPNVSGGRIDLGDLKRVSDPSVDVSAYRLAEGDLLIVRTNGSKSLIGRSAVVREPIDAAFASYLIRYRFRTDLLSPEWAQVALSAPGARTTLESLAASSAGQYNLSVAKLDSVEIPLPALVEQRRMLDEINEWSDSSHRIATSLDTARARSASLRRALLAAAFAGELTGRESDTDRIEELADASHHSR